MTKDSEVSFTENMKGELTADELDDEVRHALKQYIEKRIGVKKYETKIDKRTSIALIVQGLIDEQDSDFASVVASYVALRSQERQAHQNLLLQIVLIVLTLTTVLSTILSFLRNH